THRKHSLSLPPCEFLDLQTVFHARACAGILAVKRGTRNEVAPMNISWRIIILVIACIALGVPRLAEDTRNVIPVEGDVEGTHHPSIVSIVKQAKTWYWFATVPCPSPQGHFPMRCSQHLLHWTICDFV